MSKHTPGPWEVRPSNNEIINADHGRLPFGIAAGYTLIGALYENDANARLIAAAPELLEALKVMVEETCVNTVGGIHLQARAVIAKATGSEE